MKFTTTFAIISAVAAAFAAAAPLHGSNGLRRGFGLKHDERHHPHTRSRKGKKHPETPEPTPTVDWDQNWAPQSPTPTPDDQAWQAEGWSSWDGGNDHGNNDGPPTPTSQDQPQPTDGGTTWDQGGDENGGEHNGDTTDGDENNSADTNNGQPQNQSQQAGGNSGGSLTGEGQSGQVTTYNLGDPSQNGRLPAGSVACYTLNRVFSDSDFVAAIPASEFNLGVCGKTVHIKGPAGECDVVVVDSCMGGGCKNFDLSPAAMQAINGVADGVVDVKFSWLD